MLQAEGSSIDLPTTATHLTLVGSSYNLFYGSHVCDNRERPLSGVKVATLVTGFLLAVVFVTWELRARVPMVPMHFFRSRAFSAHGLRNEINSSKEKRKRSPGMLHHNNE